MRQFEYGVSARRALAYGGVPVAFSQFLTRYAFAIVGREVIFGSREGLDYALFQMNKFVRPRRRGLRNPSRGGKRTDFGRRFT